MQTWQKNNIYKNEGLNLEILTKISRLSIRKSNNQNNKDKLFRKKMVFNLKILTNIFSKKYRWFSKNNWLDRKIIYKVIINFKIQNLIKV